MSEDMPYCVSFDTKEAAPRIVGVAVKLSKFYMTKVDSARLDLCDHPLYPALRQYCLDNPPSGRRKKKEASN